MFGRFSECILGLSCVRVDTSASMGRLSRVGAMETTLSCGTNPMIKMHDASGSSALADHRVPGTSKLL
jgi:hypothetical protein